MPNSLDGRTSFEVVFDPTPGLDPWEVQLLHASRYLASLILELERCRTLASAGASAARPDSPARGLERGDQRACASASRAWRSRISRS